MKTGPSLRLMASLLIVITFIPAARAEPARGHQDDLTQEYAQFRKAQLGDVAYDLSFRLEKDAKTFQGTTRIDLTLNHVDAPLSIDLTAEEITSIRANGETITDATKREGSFDIPAAHLRVGENEIEIRHVGAYTTTGQGLCHMTDPVDNKEYLYTNFEPYGAHRVFPCFDQPDIKATYTLSVNAPLNWEVMGNQPILAGSPAGDRKEIRFGATPLLSTYLFFLGSGDYQAWHDTHHGQPLAIYTRASLAQYLDTDRLFAETKAGLDYFARYFDSPYPFEKYDHVFAPELQAGAMENPGAVTMNESMIFRGAVTDEDYRGRNNTLLHEMAHMWFGDLVTMAWWNDLWLNESFATFSAYQAQASMGDADIAWRDFYDLKGWAYYQDQLSTTHPIETEVTSVQLATSNFDGITYAKGASALKQLAFYVGDEAYQHGVAQYFKTFAWKNATRTQFIDAIATSADLDLGNWTERWLQTEGLSKISLSLVSEGDHLAHVTLAQESLNAPRLSPHKTRIGVFRLEDSGALTLDHSDTLTYETTTTDVPWLAGVKTPDFLYPNYADMDYGLFFLDDASIQTALHHLAALEDPFTRQMVWGTLFSMVRHQKLTSPELMEVLLKNLPRESDVNILDFLVGGGSTSQLFFNFLTPDMRRHYAPDMERMLSHGLRAAASGSDERLIWQDGYVRLASRPEARETLETLLLQEGLDQPRRWRLLNKLATLNTPDMEARIAAEAARDATAQGTQRALGCRAALPDLENKKQYWTLLTGGSLAIPEFRAVAGAFYNALYPDLGKEFQAAWLTHVRAVDWEQESHNIRTWFGDLFPPIYAAEDLKAARDAFSESSVAPRARRAWQEALDRAAKIVAIRNHDAQMKSNIQVVSK